MDAPTEDLPVDEQELAMHLARAGELLRADRLEEAAQEIKLALALSPLDLRARNLLGLLHFRGNRFEEAQAVYQELLLERQDDTALRLNLGLVELRMGNHAAAVEQLAMVAEAEPDNLRALGYYGLALMRAGDLALARQILRRAGQEELVRQVDRMLSEAAGTPAEGDPPPRRITRPQAALPLTPPGVQPRVTVEHDAPPLRDEPDEPDRETAADTPVAMPTTPTLRRSVPPAPMSPSHEREREAARSAPPADVTPRNPQTVDVTAPLRIGPPTRTGEMPRVTGEMPRVTGELPRVTGELPRVSVPPEPPRVSVPPEPPRATGEPPRITGELPRISAPPEPPRVSVPPEPPRATGEPPRITGELPRASVPPEPSRASLPPEPSRTSAPPESPRPAPPPLPNRAPAPAAPTLPAQPPGLMDFVRARELAPPPETPFSITADGLLLVRVSGQLPTRSVGVVVSIGELNFEPLQRRSRGRMLTESFGDGAFGMFRATGSGMMVISPRGGHFAAVRLQDESLYIRESLAFAFAESLHWENGRLPGAGPTQHHPGFPDDLARVVQFRGTGQAVLRSERPLVTVRLSTNQHSFIEVEQLVGWVGRVIPSVLTDPDGAPTPYVECTGEGYLLVEPPPAVPIATPGVGAAPAAPT